MSFSPRISVILTAWNRPQYLDEQVQAILGQTVAPHEIVLWYNKPSKRLGLFSRKLSFKFAGADRVKKIVCDFNFGIFPRFCMVPCLEGEYVCVFDDDTIPGKRWFENCLHYVDADKCVLGTIGLRYLAFDKGRVETEKPRMGWEACNKSLEFVDIVGHAWLFRKAWIKHFWEEPPLLLTFGEDIHLCSMFARHGIRAACPPHPVDDKSLWGSTAPERGLDKVAISSKDRSKDYLSVVQYEIQMGYRPILL